jgi:hypothetical protein
VAGSAAMPKIVLSSQEKSRDQKKIARYRELGKTGLKMSDISFGTGKLNSASLIGRGPVPTGRGSPAL